MAITRAQQARQMLRDGDVAMQGGVKNYLGEQETVSNVPVKWKSGPNKPATELAYITEAEKNLLLKEDIHGSLKDGPNKGPKGIMSLDSAGDRGDIGGRAGVDVEDTVGSKDRGTGDYQVTDPQAQQEYDRNRAIRDYNRRQAEKINRAQKVEQDKKLNFAEKFRVLSLKNLIDQKKGLKRFSPSFFGTISNITNPQLTNYEKSDPELDDYGMTGQNLTDIDRMVDAIDKANLTGDITQGEFEKAFFGDKGPPVVDDKGEAGIVPRIRYGIPAAAQTAGADDSDYYGGKNPFDINRIAYRLMADGGAVIDDEPRQADGLGSIVKKIKRTVKKVVKSPIGKAAIAGAALYYGGAFKPDSFFTKKILPTLYKEGALTNIGKGLLFAGVPAIAAGLMTPKEEEQEEEQYYRGEPLNFAELRPYGVQRFAEGGDAKEPVAKKVMPLIDMGGKEKDYRETGGFVDIGRMEKADDVPARLSKNEFVFTADAVRNAGDGSVDKGAEVMYNMMKTLEAGGEVSEESQGLEGARKMFQTSQRLEEVL